MTAPSGSPESPRLAYHRSRFSTHLPVDRRYTQTHYWLLEDSPGVWRVGLTRFGLRLLGDIVECGFMVAPGAPITIGQEIGSVEGFKAATSICSAVEGEFVEASADLQEDAGLAELEPYGRGWLYRVRGRPDPESVDVTGYVSILDAAIDAWLHRQ